MKDTLAVEWGMINNLKDNFYTENQAEIELLPNVNGLYTDLFGQMVTIGNVNIKQLETSVGITLDKKGMKKLQAKNLYKVAAVGYLIATDNEMKKKVDKSESVYGRMKDEDLINISKSIYDLLYPLRSQMTGWGITDQDFANLNTSYNNFKDWEKKPHAKIKARSHLSDRQSKLIWEAVGFINDKLDRAMNVFKTSNPGVFYNYLVQRRLPNPGVSFHEGLELFTFDEVTKEILAGSEVQVPNEYIEQLKLTDDKGRAYFDLIIEGEYNLTIKKAGYQDYTAKIVIRKHRRTVLNILMKKI